MNVYCRDLGQMDYKACWDLQQSLFDVLTAGKTNRTAAPESATPSSEEAGTILLVEHPPVYTLGKSGHAENLLVGREALEAMGAQFFHIDRGGDITFHGPGQLVCYPILDLERLGIGLRAYIDALEESVIRTVAEYGIRAVIFFPLLCTRRRFGRLGGSGNRAGRRWPDGGRRRKMHAGGRSAQDMRNRSPFVALYYHAWVRAERNDRSGVVFAHQPLRIHRPGRDLDRKGNGRQSPDGRCQKTRREIFK